MLKEKYVRPTTKEHGHTKIFYNDIYLGYIMPYRNKFRTIGNNWSFTPKHEYMISQMKSNRDKIIKAIEVQVKNNNNL